MSSPNSAATSRIRSKARPRKAGLIVSVRCAACCDATLTAYDPTTIHILAGRAGWTWINDNAICLRCLEEARPKTLRLFRHMQGVYFDKELTDDGKIKTG